MSQPETKLCKLCNTEKPVTEFYKHKRDGYRSQCKKCQIAYQRKYPGYSSLEYMRKYNAEYRKRPDFIAKNKANIIVSTAIRWKGLKKKPCIACGVLEKVQAHHEDYSKPLDITWLCPTHHNDRHHNGLKIEEFLK